MRRRALETWEREYGPEHPKLAAFLNNQATLRLAQGEGAWVVVGGGVGGGSAGVAGGRRNVFVVVVSRIGCWCRVTFVLFLPPETIIDAAAAAAAIPGIFYAVFATNLL